MFEQIRAAAALASAVTEVPRRQAERLARELARRGELTASQVSAFAEELVERSRQNADAVRSLVRSEIRRQVKALGLATGGDLERLERRIRSLEGKAKVPPKSKSSRKPAKKSRT